MGLIEDKHAALGGNGGELGRARGGRITVRGGELQRFQQGLICARRATGAVVLRGAMADKWLELGGAGSSLGLPSGSQTRTRNGEDLARFDRGTLRSQTAAFPMRVYQQNCALLGIAYKGRDRRAVLDRLVTYLRQEKPDVVGFSEVFVNGERAFLKQAFAHAHQLTRIERHAVEGPDEADLEEDSGLLLLSRLPFEHTDQSIYRQYAGIDGKSNKGVVHGRIRDRGVGYDLFLSHMQDPDASDDAKAALEAQYRQLATFVDASRNSMRPALIMGDLNTRKSMRKTLLRTLSSPEDLWVTSGDGSDGITTDRAGGFRDVRPLDSQARFQHGDRVDYFLSHRCDAFWPDFDHTRVEILQTRKGHDVSDHYGVVTTQQSLRGFVVRIDRPVKRVRASVEGFTCLEETDEAGDDEVSFSLFLRDDTGRQRRVRTKTFDGVSTGQSKKLRSPNAASLGPIAKHITLTVQGFEHDGADRDDLGTERLHIGIDELKTLIGRPRVYTLPLLARGGGQYAVRVRVAVS